MHPLTTKLKESCIHPDYINWEEADVVIKKELKENILKPILDFYEQFKDAPIFTDRQVDKMWQAIKKIGEK